MSRLRDLQKDVADMSTEELLEYVRGVRADRGVSKKAVRTTTKKSRTKKKDAVRTALAGMSTADIKKLLEKL